MQLIFHNVPPLYVCMRIGLKNVLQWLDFKKLWKKGILSSSATARGECDFFENEHSIAQMNVLLIYDFQIRFNNVIF